MIGVKCDVVGLSDTNGPLRASLPARFITNVHFSTHIYTDYILDW